MTNVEPYIIRLLDECRNEIQISDSKASIMFAAVAGGSAILGNAILDETSDLRTDGGAATALAFGTVGMLVVSMILLGLAVIPRVGRPEAGKARYFEEQALFANYEALLAAVSEGAADASDRHAQQLLTLSRIARRKYQHLRRAMYAVCVAMATLGVALLLIAID